MDRRRRFGKWAGAVLKSKSILTLGLSSLLNYVSVCDTGKAINPEQCIGQDEGAVMFGIGHTLMEEMIYEDGQLLNGNLVDYRVPTFEDLPATSCDTILIENGNGPGPFGSKGIGEGGLLPVASAIANAVSRAVGVRIQDLPLTPPKIWRAFQAKIAKYSLVKLKVYLKVTAAADALASSSASPFSEKDRHSAHAEIPALSSPR